HFTHPLSYLGKDGGAAVGVGPGHAVGAALALRDTGRIVTAVLGDGDTLMGINALWTASHFGLPLLIVVANNASYFNDELHQERVANSRERPAENRWIGQRLTDPEIDVLAMAGAQGFQTIGPVRTRAALDEALQAGAKTVASGGRVIIDARIEPGYAGDFGE
ncbi:MAG: thiamine pyrophosphate-dependent enzyme, partial [Aurantimonas coralicida]|nr:thiamine pyrophosphate-dependent enzyme [Aurantimonas coralicida]